MPLLAEARRFEQRDKSGGSWNGPHEILVAWISVVAAMMKINGPFQVNIPKRESPGFSNLWHGERCRLGGKEAVIGVTPRSRAQATR